MSAATIPFTPSQPKPWSPTSRDRLIFQWVKFEGQTQSWVASQLDIDQSTVSRTVQRYERWIARGGPVQQGSLSHDERIRAQRWLAYERNECLLASALRIAGEMERALDTSTSNITHHSSEPSREIEVRTEHKVIDRSGLACRFLRLAHRINMDQLQLVEQEPLPALEPLSPEEWSDHDFPVSHSPSLPLTPSSPQSSAGCHGHPARADRADDCSPSLDFSNSSSDSGLTPPNNLPLYPADLPLRLGEGQDQSPAADPSDDPPTPDIPVSSSRSLPLTSSSPQPPPVSIIELSPSTTPVHGTHNPPRPKIKRTLSSATTSAHRIARKKTTAPAYAVASSSPETTAPNFQPPPIQRSH